MSPCRFDSRNTRVSPLEEVGRYRNSVPLNILYATQGKGRCNVAMTYQAACRRSDYSCSQYEFSLQRRIVAAKTVAVESYDYDIRIIQDCSLLQDFEVLQLACACATQSDHLNFTVRL